MGEVWKRLGWAQSWRGMEEGEDRVSKYVGKILRTLSKSPR